MGRAPCCEKVGLNKGRWTVDEDEKLANYIMAHGEGSWRSLPKNAGLLRCGKSCRLRWINYLRGDLKRGNITQEEEDIIIKLHSTLGNRWSVIAGHLPGRTDNEIKNYWNSHLSRRLHRFCHVGEDGETTTIVLDKIRTCMGKRRGGKTSRRSMKKNLMGVRRTKHDEEDTTRPTGGLSTSLERNKEEGSNNDLSTLSLDSREISSITLDDLNPDLFQSSNDEKALELPPSATHAVDSETRIEEYVYHDVVDVGLAMNEGGSTSSEKGSHADKNKMLYWEGEGMEDEGDKWQWLWDIEDNNKALEVQAMEELGCEHQMEYLANWLLSDLL